MEWRPIALEDLNRYIENVEYIFREDEKSFWNFIKIKPEKWKEKTMGRGDNSFWVVAIFGHRVMYYNDIEEGFNVSTYQRYGEIDEYISNQIELHESIASLFDGIKRGFY